jgi:hypothetical protein
MHSVRQALSLSLYLPSSSLLVEREQDRKEGTLPTQTARYYSTTLLDSSNRIMASVCHLQGLMVSLWLMVALSVPASRCARCVCLGFNGEDTGVSGRRPVNCSVSKPSARKLLLCTTSACMLSVSACCGTFLADWILRNTTTPSHGVLHHLALLKHVFGANAIPVRRPLDL